MQEKLPKPWNEVCLVLMRYLTLEGRYGVYYYYHFPLLNYFYHWDFISIPFFILHELENTIINVKGKMRKGANITILDQGLIFTLHQFYLTLVPPRIVETNIPPHPNPWP